MTTASGVGSHPGDDQHAFDEALRLVLGELGSGDLPYLPEVPGRGAVADMVGRTLALLDSLGVDLQPAGWRLTGSSTPGLDQRRAVSLLAQDLDTLEELTQSYEGSFKVQVTGPWTLAAMVERPRGDRVLADHGARRELAQSLAAGLATHLADLRRRVPGASFVVQVDEPLLPAVLGGGVPTASGFHRHRSVDAPIAAPALEEVLSVAGDDVVVHCCAPDIPFALLERVGDPGVSVDLSVLTAGEYDGLAALLDRGRRVHLGVVPSLRPEIEPTGSRVAQHVERFSDLVGIDPGPMVLTPACGLAGADPAWARTSLAVVREAARALG